MVKMMEDRIGAAFAKVFPHLQDLDTSASAPLDVSSDLRKSKDDAVGRAAPALGAGAHKDVKPEDAGHPEGRLKKVPKQNVLWGMPALQLIDVQCCFYHAHLILAHLFLVLGLQLERSIAKVERECMGIKKMVSDSTDSLDAKISSLSSAVADLAGGVARLACPAKHDSEASRFAKSKCIPLFEPTRSACRLFHFQIDLGCLSRVVCDLVRDGP